MSASVGKRTLLAVLRTMYICGAICGGKIAEPAKKIIYQRYVAEREGFEPSRRLPAYTRSRRAPSTTRPPLLQSSRKGGHYSEATPLFKLTPLRSRGTASGRAHLASGHASEVTKRQVVPIYCQSHVSHVGRSAAKYTESLSRVI